MDRLRRAVPPRYVVAQLVIGGIVVVCVGALISCGLDYVHFDESARWPTAAGIVTQSKISQGHLKSLKAYAPDVEYRYTVLGSEHAGSTLRFSYVSKWGTEPAARKRISPFPVGRQVDIHYNPKDPSESVLEAGLSEDDQETLHLIVAGLLFFSILWALMLWQVRRAALKSTIGNL